MSNHIFDAPIQFLLDNACPSIRYLVERDICKTPVDSPKMRGLQEMILAQPNVQKILAAQREDGWFGHELHGNDGMDGLLGGLLNAGVERDHPAVQKAVHALTTPEIASSHKNWFHGGDALDSGGRGGNRSVTAQILSWVQYPEDDPLMREQIDLSYKHLAGVLNYNSVDDFTVRGKNERVYRPNVLFPGANHIAMLNATQSWRTPETLSTARAAAKHGYDIMLHVNETILFRKPAEFGGGVVGPFNFNWQALSPVTAGQVTAMLNDPYPFRFAFWLGSVSGVPDFVRQSTGTYEVLAEFLKKDDFHTLVPDKTYRAFRQVMGKEPTLRKKTAKQCDLTYALLRACCGVLG